MRIGMLTGGGDCPGLNAVIRAVVRKGETNYGDQFVGFRDGWRGLIENTTMPLDWETCRNILDKGGTILGTSRTNPYKVEGGVDKVLATLKDRQVDALVAIGGDDTLGVANKLLSEGVSAVGVPKTIDNDLSATEVTFGFHTAVQIATDAIDRLRTTAESHGRVIVCEVMGRHAGWISLYAGIAGGAVDILIPEEPFEVEAVCANVKSLTSQGRHAAIVVVAEGATPKEGSFSTTSSEVDRVAVLGHIQRGGSPTAFDRVLATRFGIAAIDAVHNGGIGTMVALQADKIVRVALNDAVSEPKLVPHEFYEEVAKPFFG